MIRIESVTAAVVQPLRRGAPGVHVLDEDPTTVHLGAWEGTALVGVISGFAITPQGEPATDVLQLWGPFGDQGFALIRALAERGRVWADSRRPGLVDVGDGRWEVPPASGSYSAASIEVLDGLEAVRRRPGMYIGSTSERGIRHLVWEIVANVVDEHLAGHAFTLRLWIDPSGIHITDDGCGIPPVAVERVCTTLHAGSSDDGHQPHVHVAGYGLGLAVVSALSSVLVVTVDRGQRYQQVFARGVALGPMVEVGPALGRGTSILFVPDTAIFGTAVLEAADLGPTLDDLAVLNPALRIQVDGRIVPSHGGLLGFARHLAGAPGEELHVRGTEDGVAVEVAVVFGRGPSTVRGWANQSPTVGSHVVGLNAGLAGAGEVRVALVAVQLDGAVYAGRTREKLDVPRVREVVRALVAREVARLGR